MVLSAGLHSVHAPRCKTRASSRECEGLCGGRGSGQRWDSSLTWPRGSLCMKRAQMAVVSAGMRSAGRWSESWASSAQLLCDSTAPTSRRNLLFPSHSPPSPLLWHSTGLCSMNSAPRNSASNAPCLEESRDSTKAQDVAPLPSTSPLQPRRVPALQAQAGYSPPQLEPRPILQRGSSSRGQVCVALRAPLGASGLRVGSSWAPGPGPVKSSPRVLTRAQAAALDMGQGAYEPNRFRQPAGLENSPAIFVDHTFYKGKGALAIKPIRPTFKLLAAGGYALERQGTLLLTFAHSAGTRVYDWQGKETFSLSVSEMGAVMNLKPGEQANFYHDPFMNTMRKGQIGKQLSIVPTKDGSGCFFNLGVRDSTREDYSGDFSVCLTQAELTILRSVMNYILPYCLGWHVWIDPKLVSQSVIRDADYSYRGER